MGFIPSGNSKDFEICPAGQSVGRLYRLLDEGTQETEWEGQVKSAHKVQLGFEVFPTDEAGEPMLMEDGRPFFLSLELNIAFGKKAKMTNVLAAWRGKPFEDGEIPDVSKMLGKWGLINVTHSTGKNGKTYANIDTIVPVPGVMAKNLPAPVNELQVFDLDMPDWNLFDSLSQWLKDKIAKSPEYAKAKEDAPSF